MRTLCLGLAIGMLSLGLAASSTAQPPHGTDVHILHHEPLPALRVTAEADAATATPDARRGRGAVTVSFDAFGRRFTLHLEPNDHIMADVPQAQRDKLGAAFRLYRGRLDGVATSWVRLTQDGELWSGAIWDGQELWLIDTSDALAAVLHTGPLAPTPYTLIYRHSDTTVEHSGCALDTSARPIHRYRALVDELQGLVQALPAATRQLDIAVVADVQFVQSTTPSVEAAVMTRMNVVDGIYAEQVGVHLNLVEIRPLQNNGTLTATSPSTLLSQFGAFASTSGFTNPGLAHLFTGRNLDGSTIGIAYIASLCSPRFGVGVSEVRGSGVTGALTVAHELGHNFGAPHDNQSGSACASTPGTFLMNPVLNGSDTFSTCSLQQIQPNVQNARCIGPLPNTPSVSITAPTDGASFAAGTAISFMGRATDSNGTDLSAAITWTSSLTGRLGVGRAITVTLAPGTHTVTAAVTNSAGVSDAQAVTVTVTPAGGGTVLFSATFERDPQGFTFVPDAFGTQQPAFVRGDFLLTGGFNGGGLRVSLGGMNDDDILNMSGGWRRTFTLAAPQRLTLSLRYLLTQAADYEPDEFSEVRVAIDNVLVGVNGTPFVARLVGNGNGGAVQTTGWVEVQLDLGTRPAGTHTVTIGGFNNKKTLANESAAVRMDDVMLRGASALQAVR